MPGLERFWNLPQAPYETGRKTPVDVLVRRLIKNHSGSTNFINAFTAPFLSDEVRGYKDGLSKLKPTLDRDGQVALDLLQRNLFYFPQELFLRASPDHCDNWFRDSFVGTLNLNQPAIEDHLIRNFERWGDHLPTVRLFPPGSRAWYFNDEVVMLGLIWRAKLQQQGVDLSSQMKEAWKNRWLTQVKTRVSDGRFVTKAGAEKSWFDAFQFKSTDVISYNQGVYAVATRAADQLGIADEPGDSKGAADVYSNLAKIHHRLPLSDQVDYKDLSSLFGEFLSLSLFGESLLPDGVVQETFDSQPKTDLGIPIVVRADNSYLSPDEFNSPYVQGDYQNGGEWPLFSATARATAELHGLKHERCNWMKLMSLIEQANQPEYFYTTEEAIELNGNYYNIKRGDHLWNAAIYYTAKLV